MSKSPRDPDQFPWVKTRVGIIPGSDRRCVWKTARQRFLGPIHDVFTGEKSSSLHVGKNLPSASRCFLSQLPPPPFALMRPPPPRSQPPAPRASSSSPPTLSASVTRREHRAEDSTGDGQGTAASTTLAKGWRWRPGMGKMEPGRDGGPMGGGGAARGGRL